MNDFSRSSDSELAIAASETSSKNDFDYLLATWNIKNRTLKEPLTGSDEWEEFDATQCRVVELRYFAGLGIEETAEALGVSPATVKRDWAMAKVWLRRRIEGSHG